MGNLFTRADTRDDDPDRIVKEVGKLFSLNLFHPPTPRPSALSSSCKRCTLLQTRPVPRSDDVWSRATASTKGSPELSIRKRELSNHQLPSSSSRRGTLPTDDMCQRPKSPMSRLFRRKPEDEKTRLPSCVIVQQAELFQQQQQQPLQQGDHCRPTPSSSIPVNAKHSSRSSGEDEQASEQLKLLYDLRTWDMYIRITEARQKRAPQTNSSPRAEVSSSSPECEDYGWYYDPNLCGLHQPQDQYPPPQGYPSPSETSMELIFGDLEL